MADDDEYSSLSDIDSDVDNGEDEVDSGDVSVSDSDLGGAMKGRRGAKKTGRKGRGKAGYIIKDALKAPRATTYTAQSLFDQILNGDIDLDPEYQRGERCMARVEAGGPCRLDIPQLLHPTRHIFTQEDGSETRVCIDGKQRLTSIYRFMSGLIYHHDRATNEKYWYQDSASADSRRKHRTLLPEKYRRLFANKQVVCVEYGDLDDKNEREIFQRVQLGMALTPAEKLAVLKSPRADFVRHLQSTFFKDDTSALTSLAWDHSRGNDFRCLATILWCFDRYWSSPGLMQNTGSIIQFEKFLNTQTPLMAKFRADVQKGFQAFEEMAASEDEVVTGAFRMNAADFGYGMGGPGPVRKDKVSPIEFICIALLILVWRDKMSLRAMAKAIKEMRREKGKGKVKEEARETKIGNKRKRTAADDEDEEMVSASGSSTPSAKRNSKTTTTTTMNKGRLVGIRMAAQQHLSRDSGPNASQTQLPLLD
ncbi:hypothetical protein AN958_11175 [Leucoagaricus sp. SymC.cos]|nr:hypothetical protein AN958_11175 [Leucoagaricus sp. SymC.cos]